MSVEQLAAIELEHRLAACESQLSRLQRENEDLRHRLATCSFDVNIWQDKLKDVEDKLEMAKQALEAILTRETFQGFTGSMDIAHEALDALRRPDQIRGEK